METYVRLMVLTHRCGWRYETLMREISDSLHLRRFCRLGLCERVPDESTVRKLTRRLGPEVVQELLRELIGKASREKRFRPRAARIDSTVVEADVRYPTDSGLAASGVRALAREGRKLAVKVKEKRTAVRDRSRAVGKRLRAITRTIRAHSGQAQVLKLTEQTGELLAKSIKETRPLAAVARRKARGRVGAAHRRSSRRPASSTSWRIAASGSSSRSPSVSAASRSKTGWCHCGIPTRGRSARASSASRQSSGTSTSCAR